MCAYVGRMRGSQFSPGNKTKTVSLSSKHLYPLIHLQTLDLCVIKTVGKLVLYVQLSETILPGGF